MQTIKQQLNAHSYFAGVMQTTPGANLHTTFPTIVIVPGGSYTHIPEAQAESVALAFAAQGFNAVYLRYSFVGEVTPLLPTPIIELGQTITQLKNNPAWPVDPNKVLVFGMSVGGHIAALYNDYWATPWLAKATNASAEVLKPAGVLLGYPVISPQLGFPPTATTLAQWTDTPDTFAAEQHVSQHNQPTFAWVTADDQLVPAGNTLSYVNAMWQMQRPVELHMFDHGPHGLALSTPVTAGKSSHANPHVAHWFELALEWIDHLFA